MKLKQKHNLMKKLFFFLLLITTVNLFSQIPSYYNDVNLNLNGNSLRNALATKIISTHQNFLSYTPGVWNALQQTDLDLNNSNDVVLIYGYNDADGNHVTDRTRSKNANGGNAGTQWNREHVYPRSLGNPNLGTSGPGADAHHLRAADITFNSQRGSKKFADGAGNAGNSSGGWYPGDEWKGDVARMMMYMYLRYGNQCLPRNVGIGNTVASDANMLRLFLEWNAEDPVSNFEKQRNPILQNIQGNRNPFIDNPAFATKIWGGPQAQDLFGNGGGNGNGGNNANLFISEYIEGSSNNKAIEIANTTGSTINLSSYSLRKATNGSNSFGSTYNLSGQLANGKVFVIANRSASTVIRNKANVTTSSGIVTFNGNDAIGLFKNNTLIDVVGNPSSNSNIIQNVTLQRKSTSSSPSSTYNASQWNRLSLNNSDDLGNFSGGNSSGGSSVLATSNFENGWDNWVDGGGDAARYSGSRAFEQSYAIRLRDNSGTASSMTSKSFNISSFDTVEIDFYFYAYSMENREDFWLRYHDGNSWRTVETWARGNDFNNNTFYNAKVTLNKSDYNFVSNAKFRFQSDASSNNDHIYIDQVKITGITGRASRSNKEFSASNLKEINYLNTNSESNLLESNFKIYPNPLNGDILKIQLNNSEETSNLTYIISSIIGKELYKGTLQNNLIKVSSLKAGIYLLEINNDGERTIQKFIKK